jgi:hypothetical protein
MAGVIVGVAPAVSAEVLQHKGGGSSTAWSLVKGVGNLAGDGLSGVSCPDATDCEAVGTAANPSNGTNQTLVERMSGSAWSVTSSPDVGVESQLLAVSCVDPSDCMAVGDYSSGVETGNPPSPTMQPLAESWNGSTWSVSGVVNVDGPEVSQAQLDAISCTAGVDDGPVNCVAVGWTQPTGGALVETWNGSTWSVAVGATSETGPEFDGQLASVSCPVPGQCMAVGSGDNQNLALQFSDGTWSLTSSPDPTRTYDNFMRSVSCPTVGDCVADWWASYLKSGNPKQKAIDWNGSAWSGTSALATGGAPEVTNVTCVTSTACVAVGSRDTGPHGIGVQKTLVERGNGSRSGWKATSSPSRTNQSELVGVSCASAAFCVAVGDSGDFDSEGEPLIASGPA